MQVLLIEDDAQVGTAVKALFEREGVSVLLVRDGETGLRRAGDPAVDLIILDRILPRISGSEVLARIRGAGLDKPVLILSALGHSGQRVDGLNAGADDYLGKPFEPQELLARVRALFRRTTTQARQPMLFYGDIELNIRARTAHRAGRHLSLSPKEFELLWYLMDHAGELVTRSMMLRHVWKLNFDPQTNVVDVNLTRLRRKLEHGFDTSCLETVRGHGYRLIGRWTTSRLSSIVVRQAVTSTIVMLVAIGLIALTARIVIEQQQHAALMATIDTDIAGLSDGMVRGGLAEVSARINDRVALTNGGDAQYRLADAKGAWIAGDLVAITTLDAAHSQSGSIDTRRGRALARATRLRGGYTLIVARSIRPTEAVVDRLMALFALASIPAALASLLAGALSAQRFSRRVTVLNRVFGRFEAGEQSARSTLDENDELGRLSGYVNRHLAQTEALFSAQRQISENIAHELRTPLGHLDARLLNMLSRNEDGPIEEELHKARDDIRAIVSLFDALLDLALVEAAENGGFNATIFNLSERIADLAELYGPSAEEAGLDFTARITPEVTMRGEPMAMTRAVANLLDNAFKFTSAGSHVRLTITQGPRITVEDDGPGVAPDLRDNVFERFRGSRDLGYKRGHGLGLALVKVIAVRHGLVPRFEDASPGARFILAPDSSS